MSKAMKIDDHSNWTGGRSKGSVFAEGVKTKEYSSAEGDGGLSPYEQTSEDIRGAQVKAVGKMKSHATKPDMRN